MLGGLKVHKKENWLRSESPWKKNLCKCKSSDLKASDETHVEAWGSWESISFKFALRDLEKLEDPWKIQVEFWRFLEKNCCKFTPSEPWLSLEKNSCKFMLRYLKTLEDPWKNSIMRYLRYLGENVCQFTLRCLKVVEKISRLTLKGLKPMKDSKTIEKKLSAFFKKNLLIYLKVLGKLFPENLH